MRRTLLLGLISSFFVVPTIVIAQSLPNLDQGWYSEGGVHNPINPSIITGTSVEVVYRSFFAFDLTGISGQKVSSATITFLGGNGSLRTNADSETFTLFDYSGSVPSLVAGTAGVPAFTDLGTGSSFGSFTITGARRVMPQFSIMLNGAGLADLNSHIGGDGLFAVGGSLTTIDAPSNPQAFFAGSNAFPAARLEYTTVAAVPGPVAGAGLFPLLGLAGAWYARRRKHLAA